MAPCDAGTDVKGVTVGSRERPFAAGPRRDEGRLPTTAKGAETCLLILFLGQRCLAVAQLAAALPAGLAAARLPALDAALAGLFLLESTALAVVSGRRRSYTSMTLAWLDVGFGMMVLLAEAVTVPLDARFTSWAGWAFPVSLGAAAGAAIALPRLWQVVTAVACLSGSYLTVTLLPATSSDQASTAITNVLAYAGFAAVLRGLSGYLRRLARTADSAREDAAWFAAYVERDRHRQLLHDQASVLAMLSGPIEDRLAVPLRRQAAEGAARIRWFLSNDEPAPPPDNGRPGQLSLREQVLATCDAFADLPVVLNIDLLAEEPPARVTVALVDALATLLHNVRRHAFAHEVVVRIECENGEWELVVSDDGVGFDQKTTPLGYGLRQQVTSTLTALGARVSVVSEPAGGTTVRASGPSR